MIDVHNASKYGALRFAVNKHDYNKLQSLLEQSKNIITDENVLAEIDSIQNALVEKAFFDLENEKVRFLMFYKNVGLLYNLINILYLTERDCSLNYDDVIENYKVKTWNEKGYD